MKAVQGKKMFGKIRRLAALILCVAIALGTDAAAQSLEALWEQNPTCGSPYYGGGAQALATAHMWVCTIAVSVFWLTEAIGGLLIIYSVMHIYIKMNIGEQGVLKDIMITVGSALFLLAAAIVLPSFFGYNYSGVAL